MKNTIKTLAIAALITLGTTLMAQTPPPPNGGNNPNQGGTNSTPVGGGGAPIGGGLLILVALGAGYGAKKVYDFKKQDLAE